MTQPQETSPSPIAKRARMPIQSIEPRRLYRQVADQLRQLIDNGEFPAGSRLPTERELALQLGVSRPTVREALIALEVDGRVRIRVGSGIYALATPAPTTVIAQPLAGPFEILAARALFEGVIAEQAARSATPAHIEAIDEALRPMRRATTLGPDSGPDSVAADRAFHLAIAAVLANDAVNTIVGNLFDQRINPYFARLASYFETPVSWQAALAEHEAIRDYIARADPAGARAAMERHLQRSQERFSRTFGDVELSHAGEPAGPITVRPVKRSLRSDPQSIAANSRRKTP